MLFLVRLPCGTRVVAGTPTDPLVLPLSFGRGDPTFISEIALRTFKHARAGSPEYPMLYVNEVLNLNLRAR